MSIREKKTARLQQLYEQLISSGVNATPTHLSGTYIAVCDPQYNNRLIHISMDSLELVKVTIWYHECQYGKSIEDRRNVIKTAKDIFEFYHDMRIGDYSKVSTALHGLQLPKLTLYYRNSTSFNSVYITATTRYALTEFLFNATELLSALTNDLNTLTKAIATDAEGLGRQLRWEKEIPVTKKWWNH